MSQHMFGVSRTKPSRRVARIMGRVARAHDVDFIEASIPGTGYQRWFTGPNLGAPHDGARADAVYADLRRRGVEVDA